MVTLQPIPHTTFQLGILAAWYLLLWHVNILQLTKVEISCLFYIVHSPMKKTQVLGLSMFIIIILFYHYPDLIMVFRWSGTDVTAGRVAFHDDARQRPLARSSPRADGMFPVFPGPGGFTAAHLWRKSWDVAHLKEAWRNLIPHGKYVPKMPHDHFMAGWILYTYILYFGSGTFLYNCPSVFRLTYTVLVDVDGDVVNPIFFFLRKFWRCKPPILFFLT